MTMTKNAEPKDQPIVYLSIHPLINRPLEGTIDEPEKIRNLHHKRRRLYLLQRLSICDGADKHRDRWRFAFLHWSAYWNAPQSSEISEAENGALPSGVVFSTSRTRWSVLELGRLEALRITFDQSRRIWARPGWQDIQPAVYHSNNFELPHACLCSLITCYNPTDKQLNTPPHLTTHVHSLKITSEWVPPRSSPLHLPFWRVRRAARVWDSS